MQLTSPFKAIKSKLILLKSRRLGNYNLTTRALFKKFLPNPPTADYQKWRHRFLLDRVNLTAWIVTIAYPTFFIMTLFIAAGLNAAGDSSKAVSQDKIFINFIEFIVTELCSLLCLTLLRMPWARRYPESLFLGLSWSVTLLSQVQAMFRGEAEMATLAWFMMFPMQATLMPVRWTLHLASQVGAIGFYFAVYFILGLKDPNIKEFHLLVHAQIVLIFFWLCFVCDLGVYLYERLQRSEFESRQQLRVFLHAVSHDLRNPVLGTVMVLKNLLNQSGEMVQVSRSMLERIIAGSDRQLDLINSLLEAHNTELRGVKLHCQPIQLSPLIQSAIANWQPMLTKEKTILTDYISPELPQVNADPLQLWRVYENLIANALKHNPPGLNLTLSAQQQGDRIRCTIADDGIGMSKEQCHKLFDLYFQGVQARRSLGLGLGLYLCRQIIIAHGGEIGVNSYPGKGTTFWFTLPVALSPSTETAVDDVQLPAKKGQLKETEY